MDQEPGLPRQLFREGYNRACPDVRHNPLRNMSGFGPEAAILTDDGDVEYPCVPRSGERSLPIIDQERLRRVIQVQPYALELALFIPV